MNPREISLGCAESFFTDVKATVNGASFAVNESGQLYRWGFNQVDSTESPIYDRFSSIVNYRVMPMYFKNCTPTRIGYTFYYTVKISFRVM